MRAVSTVLDVAVFLLLVSAAVATLAVPAAEPPPSRAGETAETLAESTGNVTYGAGMPSGDVVAPTRTASGTHAELLARGAMANLTLDGTSLSPAAGPFRTAVRKEVETALAWSSARVGVVATWEPYPDAPIHGRFAAGAQPPVGVDVSTATLSVPVSTADAPEPTPAAADSYRGVAVAVVDALLGATLARERPSVPPAGGPVRRDWERRAEAYASAVGADPPDGGRVGDQSELREALTDRLATDLSERYETPAAAATALRVGQVEVVVRRWSA